MSTEIQLVIFMFTIIAGVMFEGIYSRHYFKNKKKSVSHHFQLARYLFLITMPMMACFITFFLAGQSAVKIFFLFAFLGPLLEWCIGFSYHGVVGEKLWTYKRFAINGNTSLLTIPFWGLAGVLFYYLTIVVK